VKNRIVPTQDVKNRILASRKDFIIFILNFSALE